MRQAAKEALENNLIYYILMQGVIRAYVNKCECSVQEAVCHVLPNYICVKFSQVCVLLIAIFQKNVLKFWNLKQSWTWYQDIALMLLNKTMLIVISVDQMNVFCDGSHEVLDSFCFADFLAYYTPVSKNCNDQQHEYEQNVLSDQLIEKSHFIVSLQLIN